VVYAVVSFWRGRVSKSIHYYFENNLLCKRMSGGVDKIVLEPHLRASLIRATNLDTKPFEIKKMYSLLEPVYT
jgi:hypothetical protein